MPDTNERSAYPHPREFAVMRPEYTDLEDGGFVATITVSPFSVEGQSVSRPGARRAALHKAQLTYRSYHSTFVVESPFPEEFTDQEGMQWNRLSPLQRQSMGDYSFEDMEGEVDYADIDQMLMWDVRPV